MTRVESVARICGDVVDERDVVKNRRRVAGIGEERLPSAGSAGVESFDGPVVLVHIDGVVCSAAGNVAGAKIRPGAKEDGEVYRSGSVDATRNRGALGNRTPTG